MRRKGFTLIELLVVIAIIAILAAILFPVFMRAKVTANTQKCMSHGRELGMAMQEYMDDNSGRFPSAATDEMIARFNHITWRYRWPAYPADHADGPYHVGSMNQMAYIQLAPYVKNATIWICPSPMTYYSMKYAYLYRNSWFFRTGNLGQNNYPDTPFHYHGAANDPRNDTGLTAAEVQASDLKNFRRYVPPTRKFFACCYALGDEIPVGAWSGGPSITPSYAHDEGSVFVYLDGHAKYMEMGRGFAPVRYTNDPIDLPHPRH